MSDPRLAVVPDIHGHAKGEHKLFAEERPIPYHARLIFLWFYHAAQRRSPRFVMVTDHVNYLTFEDPAAVSLVRRALKLALAGDLYGASETAKVDMHHAKVVSDALRAGMRFSIGAEVDNDPRSRPDAQNVIDAMKPDGIIRSIHFLPIKHPETGEDWMWPFDNPEFKHVYDIVGTEQTWQLYTDLMVDAVKTLPGDILGHLHVPGKFGHWPADDILEQHEDRILDACAERGMGIEINTRVFYRSNDAAVHEHHLNIYRRLLRKCTERELPIAIGSDAHSPRDQGRGIERILPLLDELDINEIVFPINGTLARVALRSNRPIKQRPSVVIQPARQVVPLEAEADGSGSPVETAGDAAQTEGGAPLPTVSLPPAIEHAVIPASVEEVAPVVPEVPVAEIAAAVVEASEPASLDMEPVETAPAEETPHAPKPVVETQSETAASADVPAPKKKPAAVKKPAAKATETATPIPDSKVAAKPAAKAPAKAKAAAEAKPAKAKAAIATAKKPTSAKPTAAAKSTAAVKSAAKPVAKTAASAKPPAKKTASKPTAAAKKPAAKAPVRKAPAKPIAKSAAKKAPVKKAAAPKKSKPGTKGLH